MLVCCRWFVLHPTKLCYWTDEGGVNNSEAQCKGKVLLKDVHAIERVSLQAFRKPHTFQVAI